MQYEPPDDLSANTIWERVNKLTSTSDKIDYLEYLIAWIRDQQAQQELLESTGHYFEQDLPEMAAERKYRSEVVAQLERWLDSHRRRLRPSASESTEEEAMTDASSGTASATESEAQQIEWIGTQKQLLYLFRRLMAAELVSDRYSNDLAAVLSRVFTQKGRPISAGTLRQQETSMRKLHDNSPPRGGGDIVDSIVTDTVRHDDN